jgi:hypothetical protein
VPSQLTNISAGSSQNTGSLLQCGGSAPEHYLVFCKPQISNTFLALTFLSSVVPRLVAMMLPPATLPCREQAAWGAYVSALSVLSFYLSSAQSLSPPHTTNLLHVMIFNCN